MGPFPQTKIVMGFTSGERVLWKEMDSFLQENSPTSLWTEALLLSRNINNLFKKVTARILIYNNIFPLLKPFSMPFPGVNMLLGYIKGITWEKLSFLDKLGKVIFNLWEENGSLWQRGGVERPAGVPRRKRLGRLVPGTRPQVTNNNNNNNDNDEDGVLPRCQAMG